MQPHAVISASWDDRSHARATGWWRVPGRGARSLVCPSRQPCVTKTEPLRGEDRVLVCPETRSLCALAGPCVSWPGRPGAGSAPATASRDDLDDRVRRQQQVAEQRVCPRDTKRPRHLEGVQVLSQQSAPGGIRTPNLLIRNQMLYPLSYGRSAASGIPGRNVAKDYRLTLPRRKSAQAVDQPQRPSTTRQPTTGMDLRHATARPRTWLPAA